MEKEIEVYGNLESAVYTLLAAKARGEHVYCNFNGHRLHSDSVTMDSAYQEVCGCTKEEFDKQRQEWLENYKREEAEREAREAEYAERVAQNRSESNEPITMDKVVAGIKYICEHQDVPQKELIEGLLALGCNFSLQDIVEQFPTDVKLFEGLAKGDISCGASVIANVRDSEYGRSFCDDRFLSVDDGSSLYSFIRTVTGDESYTKANIDALSSGKKM